RDPGRPAALSDSAAAAAIMDEKVEVSASSGADTVEAGLPATQEVAAATEDGSPADFQTAAGTAATTVTARSVDLNELQELSDKKHKAHTTELSLYLHAAA